jgi:hypothetical protein
MSETTANVNMINHEEENISLVSFCSVSDKDFQLQNNYTFKSAVKKFPLTQHAFVSVPVSN